MSDANGMSPLEQCREAWPGRWERDRRYPNCYVMQSGDLAVCVMKGLVWTFCIESLADPRIRILTTSTDGRATAHEAATAARKAAADIGRAWLKAAGETNP